MFFITMPCMLYMLVPRLLTVAASTERGMRGPLEYEWTTARPARAVQIPDSDLLDRAAADLGLVHLKAT